MLRPRKLPNKRFAFRLTPKSVAISTHSAGFGLQPHQLLLVRPLALRTGELPEHLLPPIRQTITHMSRPHLVRSSPLGTYPRKGLCNCAQAFSLIQVFDHSPTESFWLNTRPANNPVPIPRHIHMWSFGDYVSIKVHILTILTTKKIAVNSRSCR